LADLQKGDTFLYGADKRAGIIAIQIAKSIGAEVLRLQAEHKFDHLKWDNHIFNHRQPGYR
jgi:hypothetical protein